MSGPPTAQTAPPSAPLPPSPPIYMTLLLLEVTGRLSTRKHTPAEIGLEGLRLVCRQITHTLLSITLAFF